MTDFDSINEQVARKLGWKKNDDHEVYGGYLSSWKPKEGRFPPNFSRDIRAAGEILQAWKGDWRLTRQNNIFHCELFRPSEEFDEWADTAPLAICKAFLQLP